VAAVALATRPCRQPNATQRNATQTRLAASVSGAEEAAKIVARLQMDSSRRQPVKLSGQQGRRAQIAQLFKHNRGLQPVSAEPQMHLSYFEQAFFVPQLALMNTFVLDPTGQSWPTIIVIFIILPDGLVCAVEMRLADPG